jgi:hypothetical protein
LAASHLDDGRAHDRNLSRAQFVTPVIKKDLLIVADEVIE